MKITQIQLIGDDNTITGYLDVEASSVFPLTFAISEIRDISKRKGTTSKSITLPRNKNNNIFLNNYYDVNITPTETTFDINKVQNVNIIQNGVAIMENAVMQLASVNKNTYTVTVKDKTADFFTTINNKYLTDLVGFNWTLHRYTAANVIASFDNTVADGYKYVMPYNPSDVNVNDTVFDLTEFTPGIYAKTYMDKIFSNAGYSYYWADMDSESIQFSKLIIPYNGEKPTIGLEESSEFNVEANRVGLTPSVISTTVTSDVNVPFTGSFKKISDSAPTQITLPNEVTDPGSCYNPSTSEYTTPLIGTAQSALHFEYTVEYDIIVNNPSTTAYLKGFGTFGTTSYPFALNLEPRIMITKGNPAAPINVLSNYRLNTGKANVSINVNTSFPNGNTTVYSGTASFTSDSPGIEPATIIKEMAYLKIDSGAFGYHIFKNSSSATQNGNDRLDVKFKLRIKNMTLKIVPKIAGTYGYNVPVSMYKYIPQKVKQSDFLKSIFTMFNLYSEVDRDNPTRINIKSRNNYYDDGKINDWTKKLCLDKEQELKFLPELTKKKMLLTYKEDKDIANETYKTATAEVYGQQEFIFDNEYVRNIEKQEIIFSPTPMFNTKFGSVNPLWVGGSPKCNIRILLDGGTYSTIAPFTIYDYWFANISQSTNSMVYPHISHWNKPVDPTFDINFGVCDYYFRWDNYGSNTNNNLFNLHWRRTLEQINNGKLMTAYFNLNEADIYQMRLSDKIRIDNSWWNINKIQDYDANNNTPTKVELISIDTRLEIPFVPRSVKKKNQWSDEIVIPKSVTSGIRTKYLSTILSEVDIPLTGIYNYVGPDVTTGSVMGNSNWITGNSIVFGDNNNVDGSGAFVMGSSNSVPVDAVNAIVFGDQISATQSNTVYVDNLVVSPGGLINGNSSVGLGVDYVRGWEAERENGNTVTIGKGKGKLFLTNSSNDVTGIGTSFSVTDLDSPSRWSQATIHLSDGTPRFILFGYFTGDDYANISAVYSDNQQVNDLGGWIDDSGEYEYYPYWIPSVGNDFSLATGLSTQANNFWSQSSGWDTMANGIGSIATGNNTIADGDYSQASGKDTIADGDYSFATGNTSRSFADYSFASGFGNIAVSLAETVIGIGAVNGITLSNTFVPTDPILRVGIGTTAYGAKDGFRLYKNGAMYLAPTASSTITNSVNGFFVYNDTDKRLSSYDGSTWSNYVNKIDNQKKQNLPTGFIQGLTLSVTPGDNTKFNIGAGAYTITDFTDLANIDVQIYQLPLGMTGITPAYLNTNIASYIAIDQNQTIIQSSSPFDNDDRRVYALLGAIIHSNLTTINTTNEIKAPVVAPTNQLHDFMQAIGKLNLNGNEFTANGANLSLNKSAGQIFGMGINAGDFMDPHRLTIGATSAFTFRYRLSNSTEFANTTVLDPTQYESAPGALTALSNNNRWSIQHVNMFQSGLVRVQYGQHEYTSFENARGNAFTETFTVEQNIADNSIFRAYVILKKNTTNLASAITAGDAAIISVDKFGNAVGGPGNALTSAAIIAALGYTPEDVANKATGLTGANNTTYPTTLAVSSAIGAIDLQQATNVGATTTNFVTLNNGLNVNDSLSFGPTLQIPTSGSLHPITISNINDFPGTSDLNASIILTDRVSIISNNNAANQNKVTFNTASLSAGRTVSFQDTSGTVSYTSDLASATASLYTSIVKQTITNGVTVSCPSQDAVFDALALKANVNNVVDLSSNQSIAGQKDFSEVVFKTDTSGSGHSGGGFILGNLSNMYDKFLFISRDDSDSDSFGQVYIQANPEEGIVISQTSIDGTQYSQNFQNNTTYELTNYDNGKQAYIKLDGVNEGVIVSGASGQNARLKTNNISGTKDFQFINANGTIPTIGTTAPASASATGVTGEIRVTSTFVYMCIATNTWVRAAMATW